MNDTYKVGMIVTGYVTGIKEYGIFVCLDNETSGLIHISEISKKFVKNVGDFVTMKELIRVKIIGMEDPHHYQLSIKDVDYRITRRHDSKIIETASGFNSLALNLEKWIRLKEKEIKK